MRISDSVFESLDSVSLIMSTLVMVLGLIGFVVTLFFLVKTIGEKKYKQLKSLFFSLVICGMCICVPSLFAPIGDLAFSMSYDTSSSSDFSWLSYIMGVWLFITIAGVIKSEIRRIDEGYEDAENKEVEEKVASMVERRK